MWWVILLVGLAFGVVVVAIAAFAARSRLTDLQMSMTTLDEHKRAAERLGERAEKMQSDIADLQAKLPQPGS